VATEPQPLDSLQLIRRKRVGEEAQQPVLPEDPPAAALELVAGTIAVPEPVKTGGDPETAALRMKARETAQLAAVHVRIPEDIARGLKLMSVFENRQAQVIVAGAIEAALNAWNPRWRETLPARS